jgi:hypothetical protein
VIRGKLGKEEEEGRSLIADQLKIGGKKIDY